LIALLGAYALLVMRWCLSSESWIEYFTIAFSILCALFGAIGYLVWYTFGTAIGSCLAVIIAFLLVYPCVSKEEALKTAQTEVDKMKQGLPVGYSMKTKEPKLDRWTWHVPVERTSLNATKKFCIDIHAKRHGKVRRQHDVE